MNKARDNTKASCWYRKTWSIHQHMSSKLRLLSAMIAVIAGMSNNGWSVFDHLEQQARSKGIAGL
jgi:hypothetical protein